MGEWSARPRPRALDRHCDPCSGAARGVQCVFISATPSVLDPRSAACESVFPRRKDRVSQRRHHTRGTRFADTPRRLQALHKGHFDMRHFVDAQDAIVAEVGLLDPAVLDGDLAI